MSLATPTRRKSRPVALHVLAIDGHEKPREGLIVEGVFNSPPHCEMGILIDWSGEDDDDAGMFVQRFRIRMSDGRVRTTGTVGVRCS